MKTLLFVSVVMLIAVMAFAASFSLCWFFGLGPPWVGPITSATVVATIQLSIMALHRRFR